METRQWAEIAPRMQNLANVEAPTMVTRVHRKAAVLIATLIALSTVASCAARRRGPDEPAPGEPWVRKVRVKGTSALDADDIKEGLATRPPQGRLIVRKTRLDTALIERDRARIRTYYQSRGFFDARVTAAEVKTVSAKKSDVVFHVHEGERSNVTEISITGLPDDVANDPKFDLGVEEGDPFDHGDFSDGQSTIEFATLEKGYAHADISGRAEVDRSRREVLLRYTIDSGPKVYFGDVEVRGLDIIPESAVRNRLKLETGELFHPRKISQTKSSIRSLGRFGVVRVDFQESSDLATGDLAVTVAEAPRREVKAGGGLGIDQNNFQVRARAEYTYHGLIDPLLSFNVQARPAYVILRADRTQRKRIIDLSTSLTREDLIWPLAQGKATLGFDVDVLEAYSSQGGDAHLKVTRPLWDQKLLLGVGWRMELLDFTRIEEGIDAALRDSLGLSTPYRSAYFEQSIALDLRDSPLNSRNGVWARLRIEEGGSLAGGSFEYGRVGPEIRGYYGFGERLAVAARASLGWPLWGSLPITRRFFAGGANSHRGFSQRRLSPTAGDASTGVVGIGGDKAALLILETRVNITELWGEWLGLSFFADGGDTVLKDDDISPGNLHWALGTGLRYQTLVGPIRFDIGYRINRYGDGEIRANDRLAFHLFIGEAF